MTEGKVQIGWARGDISPTRKTFVQGQFHTRISDKVVSPLTVTALALEVQAENGAVEQAVLVSGDMPFGLRHEELIPVLGNRCPDLDRTKITTCGTHTHNAPSIRGGVYDAPRDDPDFMAPEEYLVFLLERVACVIEQAWQSRRAGSIARGFGYAMVGRCRRAVYADGAARMYGNTDDPAFQGLEACDDHAVNMLFTRDEGGELTGVAINLASPSQCDEHGEFFSADFWHNVREGVAAQYGVGVHTLPLCAPAGDMSPHLLVDVKEEADLRGRMGLDAKGIIARRILAAVAEGMATAAPPESSLVMRHDLHRWRLPRMMVTREDYELEKRIPAMTPEERARQHYAFQRIWPFGPVCDLVTRYERQEREREHDVESHIIRLGDAVLATNPFELFVDYAARIKARSKALQTFLVQLADGADNGFYLPTQRALDGGHYSAQIKSNWVGPEGGQMLVEHTVQAINALFPDTNYTRTR